MSLKADPDCAIAYWGIALSLLLNPLGVPPAANLAQGLAAIQKGKAIGAKTPRERDFIDALGAFYTDYDKIDHRTRGAGLSQGDGGGGATLSAGRRGANLLRPRARRCGLARRQDLCQSAQGAPRSWKTIFKRQPQHPGVAHYLIHSYDYPPIAEKGLDAATRYSKIAPAAPHAQHMPSHIFTRVGYWKESIASNCALGARRQGRQGVR